MNWNPTENCFMTTYHSSFMVRWWVLVHCGWICESTIGNTAMMWINGGGLPFRNLVEPVTSWRNGITFTVLTAFLSGTGLFQSTYTIILLSYSDACRALDRCSVLTAPLDYYRIGVILWTEKEVCLCQPYSPCIDYRCILLLTGYFLTLSWAIVLVYEERKPCIYIYKQGWKSIHNKYKVCGSKSKHTRGKSKQSKQ